MGLAVKNVFSVARSKKLLHQILSSVLILSTLSVVSVVKAPEATAAASTGGVTDYVISSGGGGETSNNCPTGYVVAAVYTEIVNFAQYNTMSAVGVGCRQVSANGLLKTGSATDVGWYGSDRKINDKRTGRCSSDLLSNDVIIGVRVFKSPAGYPSGVQLICSTLPDSKATNEFWVGATTGSLYITGGYEDLKCPVGTVAIGLRVAAGSILDRFGFNCGPVTGATQTVTFNSLANRTFGESFSLSASSSSGLTVAFTSATTDVCNVSGTTVTFVDAGTCTINANQSGNTNWAAASQVQQSFTVNRAAALNPTFGTPTATTNGFTVQITNRNASYTWSNPTVSAGSISVGAASNSNQLLTVTGLTPGQSATITQGTARTGHNNGTANVSGSALPTCSPNSSSSGGFTTESFTSTTRCNWVVPTGVKTVSVLVVGGGGGGGADSGSGGGGGGIFEGIIDLGNQAGRNFLIAVGAGGFRKIHTVRNERYATDSSNPGGSSGGSSSIVASDSQNQSLNIQANGGAVGSSSANSTTAGGTVISTNNSTFTLSTTTNSTGGTGGGGFGLSARGVGSAGAGGYNSSSSFPGSFGGGGGGGASFQAGQATSGGAGSNGGGAGSSGQVAAASSFSTAGAVNSGGGGGGGSAFGPNLLETIEGVSDYARNGAPGGSGVVLIRYVNAPVITATSVDTVTVIAGTAMTALTVSTATNSGPATFTISPTLPTGLSLDSSTGTVSGTPTVAVSATTYTITATNTSGTSTERFSLNSIYAPCSPTTSISGGFTVLKFAPGSECDWTAPTGVSAVNILVVGGGGGGAGNFPASPPSTGGSGGGGGVYQATSVPISGAITITVGAGGAGGTSTSGGAINSRGGAQGENSTFGSITAGGGGGGGCDASDQRNEQACPAGNSIHGRAGTAAGSGGSSSYYWNANNYGNPGSATSATIGGTTFPAVPGYAGGGFDNANVKAGSGGGAGGAANFNTPGQGISSSITGIATVYGKGGSSEGAPDWGLTALAAQTGTGGSGASSADGTAINGVSGSSGIVVVTYALSALVPTFDTPTSTVGGFTAQISNFDAGYTWSGTATESGTVSISTTGMVTVTGVAAGTSSTATITNTTSSYTGASATVAGTALSNVVTLSSLSLSVGTLSPTFLSGTFDYATTVLYATESITVTSTRTQPNSTIQIKIGNGDYVSVTSGSASGSLSLSEGLNTITILVTAEDGVTTQAYTIAVTRSGISTNTNLSSLTFSVGKLLQTFSPSLLTYNLSLPNSAGSYTFTPTAQESTATIKVGATSIASGAASTSYSAVVGVSSLSIVVTAQDGVTTRTYTIYVTRAPPTWLVLAAGEASKIFTATTARGTTLNNGNYFYFGGGSMGFSPNSSINQNAADNSDTNCASTTAKQRLSWHYNGTNITNGWRAGCVTGTDKRFQRAIYQSNTVPSYYPSGPQQSVSASTVESGGWSMCWVDRQSGSSSISDVRAACTGTYLLVSGGYMVTTTYNANDGSGSPATVAVSVAFDSAVTLRANTFTRNGYTFAGWSANSNGTGTQYTNSQANVFFASPNTNFYAKWVPNVTVTFNKNYGLGTPETSTQSVGTGIVTALTANTFTRSDYTFAGWSAAADGSGTQYTNSQSESFTTNTEIFAKWTAVPYTITYNLNNGSGTAPIQGSRTNGEVFVVATANGITRNGSSFGGWFDGSNSYQPSDTYTVASSNVVFTAQWNLDTYTVTYSANTGSGSAARTTDSYIYGSSAIVLPGRGTLARTGYSFIGWATSSGGAAIVGNYTPTESATVYAVWSPATYTITFNGNGATGVPASETATYTTGDSGLTLASTQGTLTKIGNDFSGWSATADGSVVNTPFTTTESLILYAVWTPIGYTVTYDLDQGNSTLPTEGNQNYNQTFTLAAAATKAANTSPAYEWAFVAWSDGTNQYAAGTTYRMGANHITLTAVWIRVFTVKYTMNGAQTAAPADIFSSESANVILAGTPVRIGYTFDGWKNQNNQIFNAGASMTISLNSYLVYAQWSPIPYEVRYDLNSGTSSQPSARTIYMGETVTVTSAPTRSGYTFNGWSYSSQLYGPGAIVIAGATDMPFVASWTAINYAVTYDMNGSATTRPTVSSKTIGQTFPLANAPTRSGYTFNKWSDGTNNLSAGATYTVASSDVTLTATWVTVNYSTTYDVNGGNGTAPIQEARTIGQTFVVAAAATHANRTFLGWSDGANIYAPGQIYTVGAADVTLSAYWSGVNYNIVYDLNGGVGTTPVQASKQGGESFTVAPGTGFERLNYTFAGWKINNQSVAVNASVGITTSDVTLISQWLPAFEVSFTSNGGTPVSSIIYSGTALAKPANPTRDNFVFEAWFDGDGLDVTWPLTPTGPISLEARWTQLSLYGLNPNTLTRFGTLNAQTGLTASFSGSNADSSVSVTVPDGALPDGTVINIDLVGDFSRAQSVITGSNDYIISFVVSWLGTDGTVRQTANGKPISMTITNSSIKAGTAVYSVIGNSATPLTRATQNGTVTVLITEDPEIVVVVTTPNSPTNVTGTSTLTTELDVSWSAPAVDGGSPIISYTATTTTGASCTAVITSCTVRGLAAGTSYTFSVVATNSIGSSSASSSATARTAGSAVFNGSGSNSGGGTSPTPAPVVPSVPTKDNVTIPPAVTIAAGEKIVARFTADEPVEWSISGGNSASLFKIAATGSLSFNSVATPGVYTVEITATDSAGSATSRLVTITVPTPTPSPTPTPQPTKVANTKPTAEMKRISNLYFAVGSYLVGKANKEKVAKVAAAIMKSSAKIVLIYGHTDSQGGVNNTILSKNRAKAIVAQIRPLLKGKSIRIGWYSASKPAVRGKTPAAFAKNRRVEIWVK